MPDKKAAADLPLWPDAATAVKFDVAVNDDGQIWVIHDQPFPDLIEWIEFDAEKGVMTFITPGGKLQNLGVTIHPPMTHAVAAARQVCLIMMMNGEIRDMGLVPLNVYAPREDKRK